MLATPIGILDLDLDNCDCIITSSKGIFFDRKNNQGDNEILEKIFYKGYIGDIAPTLLRKTVKRLLESKNDNLIDDVGNTYLAIRDKILYYMDFGGKDEIADVLACWNYLHILLSFVSLVPPFTHQCSFWKWEEQMWPAHHTVEF